MGLRLITITQKNQISKGCRRCKLGFTKQDPAFSTTRSTGSDSSTNLYHISFAREINLSTTELWWNRLTKYKRKSILIDLNLDHVDIEENYCIAYRLLSDEIKIQVDVRYYQK